MADFQPIETAPRDGTLVLLYSPDAAEPGVMLGRWLAWEYECPDGLPPIEETAPCWVEAWTDYDIDAEPTHWGPIPAIPARQKAAA